MAEPTESLSGLIGRIERCKLQMGFSSDQALCRAAGLDPDYIRTTIRRNREPGSAKLLAIARALSCSISYLVTPPAFADLVLHLYRVEVENKGDGSISRRMLSQRG